MTRLSKLLAELAHGGPLSAEEARVLDTLAWRISTKRQLPPDTAADSTRDAEDAATWVQAARALLAHAVATDPGDPDARGRALKRLNAALRALDEARARGACRADLTALDDVAASTLELLLRL